MDENYYTTDSEKKQEKILKKIAIKKAENKKIIQILDDLAPKIGKRDYEKYLLENCATVVGLVNDNGIIRIATSNFCRKRICAVCAWRRQIRFVTQMRPVLDLITNDYDLIFVTLTVKNCKSDEVKSNIDTLLNGFRGLTRLTRVKKAWKGMVRSIEVKYDPEKSGKEYHPHIHALIAVEKNYWHSKDYITQKELCRLWQNVACLEYIPVCHIERVKQNKANKEKAALEVMKYALKPTTLTAEVIETFITSMAGRRLISFTGVIAKARKVLKQLDYDTYLTDKEEMTKNKYQGTLYKFDPTGGLYKYYKSVEF